MAMREIEFRGKRKDTGEWARGGFVYDAANNPRITEAEGGGLLFHRVAPETVGQYTGHTDKKGVKIFEGDIVRLFPEKYAAKVIFRMGCWMLWLGHDGDDEYLFDYAAPGNIAVIGSIYDNPELLEDGGGDGQ
jgi:uncharacterized phage protein (TIGR01671 family)